MVKSRSAEEKQKEQNFFISCRKQFKIIPKTKYYILSCKWLNKWHAFTNTAKNDYSLQSNQPKDYPGPIIDLSLFDLEKMNVLCFDSSSFERYTNFVLRRDLIENRDFIIVSEALWNFFNKLYKGLPIFRYSNGNGNGNGNANVNGNGNGNGNGIGNGNGEESVRLEIWLHNVIVLKYHIYKRKKSLINLYNTKILLFIHFIISLF